MSSLPSSGCPDKIFFLNIKLHIVTDIKAPPQVGIKKFDKVRPSSTSCFVEHVKVCRTLSNSVKLCQTLSNFVGRSNFVKLVELCQTLSNFFELCRTLSNLSNFVELVELVELSRTLSNFVELVRLCRTCQTLSNFILSGIFFHTKLRQT